MKCSLYEEKVVSPSKLNEKENNPTLKTYFQNDYKLENLSKFNVRSFILSNSNQPTNQSNLT